MVKVFFKQAIKKAARVILPLMYWNRVNFEAFTSFSLNHFGISSFFLLPAFMVALVVWRNEWFNLIFACWRIYKWSLGEDFWPRGTHHAFAGLQIGHFGK